MLETRQSILRRPRRPLGGPAAWVPTALALLAAPAAAHVGVDVLEHDARAAVAANPRDAAARLNLAKTFQAAGRWDEALVAYDDAIAYGADVDTCEAARGQVFLAAGFPRSAKRSFDVVLQRRPDAWAVYLDRARAWTALKEPLHAADDYRRALGGIRDPKPEHVLAYRDALVAAGKPDEALRALDDGMSRIGTIASLQLPAIDMETERQHWDAALHRLDELMRQAPSSPIWITQRADILAKAGRTTEARAEYARALATIDARPRNRRPPALATLEARLRAMLAPEPPQPDSQQKEPR